jgi:hypothetical protein
MAFTAASGANITWSTDGAGNIGASGANRPDQVFIRDLVTIGTDGGSNGSLIVQSTSTSSTRGLGLNYYSNTAANASLNAMQRARGTLTTPLDVSSGDSLGNIVFRGYSSAGFRSAAQIRGVADAAPAGTVVQGRLEFLTTASSGTQTLRMTLDSIGNMNLASLTAATALVSDASKNIISSAVTATELGYVSGVTSAIQTQLNGKAPTASPTFTGTITTPLTASRAVVTGASSELVASSATATEVGYLSGVTSAIQTQLGNKASTILNNLGSTAINATLLPDTTDLYDLGSTSLRWGPIYAGTHFKVAGNVTSPGDAAVKFTGGTAPSNTGMFWDQGGGAVNYFTNNIGMALDGHAVRGIRCSTGLMPIGSNHVLGISSNSWGDSYIERIFHTGGSAAAPPISVSGDSNTGMWFSAADEVSLTTGGTSRLTVNSNQVVSSVGRKINRTASGDTNYTVLITDHYVGLTAITATRTWTLPAAATVGAGTQFIFKDESGSLSGTVKLIIDGNASETIDGATTFEMTSAYESLTLVCNGSNWFIV